MNTGFVSRLEGALGCLFGTWVKLPTSETLELLARAGFDFVVIDMEHAPLTLESVARLIAYAQSLGIAALVRVADQTTSDYQRLLDSGADGLLVPRIRHAGEAAKVVARMRFTPLGKRGMGMTSRAGAWGLEKVEDYLHRGNHGVLRCMQLEDREVLASVDSVLDVDGVNAVFLGMGDLTLSTGLPATDPGIQLLVDQLLDACGRRGIPCGAAVQNPAAARKAAERGFSFVMVSNDASIFATAALDIAKNTWGDRIR